MVRAENGTLSGVLEGKKQYQVPLYQRVYSWGKKQLDQLWSDVVELERALGEDRDRSKTQAVTGSSSLKDAQLAFFQRVRDYGRLHATTIGSWRKPLPQHWYDIGIGEARGRVTLQVNSQRKIVTTLFWIDHDKDLYANLLAQRDAIEAELGLTLEWDDRPGRKASKLVVSRPGDFLDEAQSEELIEWLVRTGDLFARVLPKYI